MRNTFLIFCYALLAAFSSAATFAAEVGKPLKVCILSGCNTYNSEESLPPFQEWLTKHYNVEASRVIRSANNDLPGLELLDDCDVAFVFIKRMPLSGDQLERFKKYATSGRPIVAVRTASHAVQSWLEFDREVLGGNYKSHFPVGPVTRVERLSAEPHPILDGVELTTVNDSLYKNVGHAADIQVLLNGTIPGEPTQPIAWTRKYKDGRIFYTSLGAQDTFQQPAFRKMLVNALFWTAGRNVETKP